MAAFVEAITVEQSLLLVLEDLQWSDASTLSLLTFLARSRDTGRMCIVGTFRSTAGVRPPHALRDTIQELALKRRCRELHLGNLTEQEIAELLARRFPEGFLPAVVSATVYRRTEGNPLFAMHLMEHWVNQGWLELRQGRWEMTKSLQQHEHCIPDGLRGIFEGQLEQVSDEERRLLEVGSVAGREFSAALVAKVLGDDLISIEEQCEALVRRRFFLEAGERLVRQERRHAARYRFIHALYRSVVYERLSQAKRCQLHRSIGAYKEETYGERAVRVAAELAVHFEEGRDYPHAVRYLDLAAQIAMQRQAPEEVLAHLDHALLLLDACPASPEYLKLSRGIHRTLRHPLLQASRTEARSLPREDSSPPSRR